MAKLGINTGIVPDDGLGDSLLDGAIKINDNFDEIYTYFGDGTNLTFTTFSGDYDDLSNIPTNLSDFNNDVGFITAFTSTNYWTETSAGIHTLSNVGIGTTNPTETLTVVGDARVTGILTIGTASITLDGSSNTITVGSGVTIDGSTGIIEATSLILDGTTFTGTAVTSITAGSGISVDQSTGNVTISATGGGGGGESYWTETSAGIHTLSNVGIGTTNPTSALTVKGNTSLETLNVSGVSTLITLSVGGTTGSDGQYLRSTGNGITWENFTSLRSVYNYSATESQKEFTAAGINTGFVDVYLNGIRLDDANYSIIGIGVSLNVGAFDGDEVTVIGFNTVNASAGGGIGGGISDVSGPGSSTDNAVTRFDGTTGKLIQNSLVTIGDDGAIVAPQVGSIIPFYFDNQAAFPSASTYHGALAHSHADGGMFYAHGGGWIQLADASDISWTQTSAGIHTLSNVGIGTTNPTSALTVSGDVSISGVVTATTFVGDIQTASLRTSELGIVLGGNSEVDVYGVSIGYNSQSDAYGVSVGAFSGTKHVTNNTAYTVAIGAFAQQNANPGDSTGIGAVAIGNLAGDSKQGSNAIALGRYAGRNDQASNSIVINATGSDLDNTTSSSFVVKPIRNVTGSNILTYNSTSGEITHTTSINTSGIITASSFVGDGSGLTGIVATGTGVEVQDDGSPVGTAATINFGNNLTVDFSGGVATIDATGGGESYWTQTSAGIHTLSSVGIGTTNPTSALQVERYAISTGIGTFNALVGVAHTFDSFDISQSNYKTVEYTVHIENESNIQSQKVLIMQNGTNVYSQEYAIMFVPSQIVSIGATISSGVCEINLLPSSGISGLTTYTFSRGGLL
jgi:hypothetical protein